MASIEWMDDALCREVGSEVFFPESNTNPRDAIEVCRRCDVEIECLNYALRLGPVAGVWGGTTEADRRRMRRRRAA